MNCGIGHKCGLDPKLLWLWPAAAAPTGPLAWKLPYGADEALKRGKKKISTAAVWVTVEAWVESRPDTVG